MHLRACKPRICDPSGVSCAPLPLPAQEESAAEEEERRKEEAKRLQEQRSAEARDREKMWEEAERRERQMRDREDLELQRALEGTDPIRPPLDGHRIPTLRQMRSRCATARTLSCGAPSRVPTPSDPFGLPSDGHWIPRLR
eukprot:9488503-Pyramimonas_sp.AAC.1